MKFGATRILIHNRVRDLKKLEPEGETDKIKIKNILVGPLRIERH